MRTRTCPSASGSSGVSTSLKLSTLAAPCGRETRRIWRLIEVCSDIVILLCGPEINQGAGSALVAASGVAGTGCGGRIRTETLLRNVAADGELAHVFEGAERFCDEVAFAVAKALGTFKYMRKLA